MVLADMVYESLIGEAVNPLKNVPNAFAEGSTCSEEYKNMLEAYEHLRERLGVVDEDDDVETIINAFVTMQEILCTEMFRLGQETVYNLDR